MLPPHRNTFGVAGARALGIRTVWLNAAGAPLPPEHAGAGAPDATIADIRQLPGVARPPGPARLSARRAAPHSRLRARQCQVVRALQHPHA
jgi:hypothetical protein